MEYIILTLLVIYMASWLVCHVYALRLLLKGTNPRDVLYYVAAGICPVYNTKVAVCEIISDYCKNLKRH
jgi:hypothetical protein